MEKQRIEDKLKMQLQKNIFIVLSIALIIYIINTYNHYKLFINKLNESRNDIIYYKKELEIEKRIRFKLSECIELIGFKLFANETNNNGNWSLIVLNADRDESIWITTIKIINLIRERYPNINIIRLDTKLEIKKMQFFERILLVDKKGIVLMGFPLDGRESSDEVCILSEYIISKIKELEENYL